MSFLLLPKFRWIRKRWGMIATNSFYLQHSLARAEVKAFLERLLPMTAPHIALVLHDFSTGGSERIAIRLANSWALLGREVTLYCGTEQGALRALVSSRVRVEACEPQIVRGPLSRYRLGQRLVVALRRDRPDIVFAPGNFHLIVIGVLARARFVSRPKFICKLSNPLAMADRPGMGGAIRSWIKRAIAGPIDTLVAMSPALGVQARKVLGSKPIAEISEPILEDFDRGLVPSAPGGSGPLILCVGRLCGQKDFFTAIRAFALLDPALDARLIILGEGLLRVDLEQEIVRYGLTKRVSMPGYIADVGPIMAAADLFLMTSQFEGYPAVLVEALAAGLAVVTTNCSPAIAEILTSPELGRWIDSRSPFALAEAMTAQLADPRPSSAARSALLAQHRITASAKAYLGLFDGLRA